MSVLRESESIETSGKSSHASEIADMEEKRQKARTSRSTRRPGSPIPTQNIEEKSAGTSYQEHVQAFAQKSESETGDQSQPGSGEASDADELGGTESDLTPEQQANVAQREALDNSSEDPDFVHSVALREATARESAGSLAERDAAAVREDEARTGSGSEAAKAVARSELELREDEWDALHGIESKAFVGGVESEFIDPEVIKQAQIEEARDKIVAAHGRLEAAKAAGDQLGNASTDEFLAVRNETTEKVKQLALGLNQLEHDGDKITVEAIEYEEATEALFKAFASMTGQKGEFFLERNQIDEATGVKVKELFYHTDQPDQLILERWNNATGKIISSTIVQCENPTIIRADIESSQPWQFLRGNFRALIGREPKLEKLSVAAERALQSSRPNNTAYESSGGTSGDYGPVATQAFQENFTKLHPASELKQKIKPKKRPSFFDVLFGRA